MKYPVDKKYVITQNFGDTDYTKDKGNEIYYFFEGKHPGIDIALPIGTPVCASLAGVVVSIEYHRGMGKVIRIRTGNLLHIYAHLSEFEVDFGQEVKEGEIIGKSGDSVCWSVPHLHFEIRDLTKYEVKDRPFKPEFEEGLPSQYKSSFVYECNRSEALIDLAIKYYGTEKGVEIIRRNNESLGDINTHEGLELGTKVKLI